MFWISLSWKPYPKNPNGKKISGLSKYPPQYKSNKRSFMIEKGHWETFPVKRGKDFQ